VAARQGGDATGRGSAAVGLTAFYTDAAALAELDPKEREERLRAWEAEVGPTSTAVH